MSLEMFVSVSAAIHPNLSLRSVIPLAQRSRHAFDWLGASGDGPLRFCGACRLARRPGA